MKHKSKSQTGFTLIEVMIVVVILGILATVVVQKVIDRPDEARITKAKQDVLTLESALNLYKLDNYVYPTTDEGLDALVHKPASARKWKAGGYGAIDIYSLGADRQPGGEGIDADIGNWNLE